MERASKTTATITTTRAVPRGTCALSGEDFDSEFDLPRTERKVLTSTIVANLCLG